VAMDYETWKSLAICFKSVGSVYRRFARDPNDPQIAHRVPSWSKQKRKWKMGDKIDT